MAQAVGIMGIHQDIIRRRTGNGSAHGQTLRRPCFSVHPERGL